MNCLNFGGNQWPSSYYDCFVFRRTRVWLSYWLGFLQISTSRWHVLHVLYVTSNPDIWNIAFSCFTCVRHLNLTHLCIRLISCLNVIDTLWTNTHVYFNGPHYSPSPSPPPPRRAVRKFTLQSLFIIDLLFVLTEELSDFCLLLTEHCTLPQGFRHTDGHMTFLWAVLGPRLGAELRNKTARSLLL